MSDLEVTSVIEDVVLRVAELPDRTSPDDWPAVMLVEPDELRLILRGACGALRVPPMSDLEVTSVIEDVVLRVAELPDRTSPDDWPAVMLVVAGATAPMR